MILVTDTLNNLNYSEVVRIAEAFGPKLGILAIFEVKTEGEFNLILNLYKPSSILLAAPKIIDALFFPIRPEHLEYLIYSKELMGMERKLVILGDLKVIDWARLPSTLESLSNLHAD